MKSPTSDEMVKNPLGFRRYNFSTRSESYIKAIAANRKEREDAEKSKIRKIREAFRKLRAKGIIHKICVPYILNSLRTTMKNETIPYY